ncbi:MAG: hypothetical protein H6740_14230 [Alphaproteobacteria bacterium]|nr:hypothetical protein [Alphaproteobacteria bacterium]
MRLSIFEDARGLHWLQRLLFTIPKRRAGNYPSPPVFLSYRRRVFGKPWAGWIQRALRESERWSKQELELFAAFTAAQLQCEY